MPDSISAETLLQMMAYKPTWSHFVPDGDGGEGDGPSIEVRAEWLTNYLRLWSWTVQQFLSPSGDEENNGPDQARVSESGRRLALGIQLESLGNAADTLLAFRRRDHLVDIPEWFSRSASLLLARADELGLSTNDRTIGQIARRLSAATSHLRQEPRQVKIDERGHVFDLSGDRLFRFDPESVLEGRRQIVAGNTHSLVEIREAGERDGR